MNVYEQIESIFSGEAEEKPQWASELLEEIREVKTLLKEQKELLTHKSYQPSTTYPQKRNGFYSFIKEFRISMRANVVKNNYPSFDYYGRKLGVDYSGLLYDKESSRTLSREEAFKVYSYAYRHKNEYKISA